MTVEGDPTELPGKPPAATTLVFLPSENPIAKKNAQTRTNEKKIASIRPVPRVISVSCCAVDMELFFTSTS
jgi:hypothetical protein